MEFSPLPLVPGRDALLERTLRYGPYLPMLYRSNLLQHSQRVRWMVESLIPFILDIDESFDVLAARTLADRHDDGEIIYGDVQLGDKIVMSAEELRRLQDDELARYAELFESPYNFPRFVGNRPVYELMKRYDKPDKKDNVAAVVKFMDKLDGYGEALHEMHAGNRRFSYGVRPGEIAPYQLYPQILTKLPTQFPILAALRSSGHPLFQPVPQVDAEQLFTQGNPHSPQSIHTPTGHYWYDYWRNMNLSNGRAAMTEPWLTVIKEH